MSERKRKDWRVLCAAVSNERDSSKLGFLVEELIAALDENEREPRVAAISGKVDDAAL
ncbi:MAG TPA: hypothetical protein VEI52_06305 [Terriglobales bacterium]|nr:hypothetical protein [Terriglobales bacterium]